MIILDDVEAADVDVEMDIPFLETGRERLPTAGVGKHLLDCKPGCLAEAAALVSDLDEQKVEGIGLSIAIDRHDRATELLVIVQDMQDDRTRLVQSAIQISIGRGRPFRETAHFLDHRERGGGQQISFEGLKFNWLRGEQRYKGPRHCRLAPCLHSGSRALDEVRSRK